MQCKLWLIEQYKAGAWNVMDQRDSQSEKRSLT
jgi:hypothetical protein